MRVGPRMQRPPSGPASIEGQHTTLRKVLKWEMSSQDTSKENQREPVPDLQDPAQGALAGPAAGHRPRGGMKPSGTSFEIHLGSSKIHFYIPFGL